MVTSPWTASDALGCIDFGTIRLIPNSRDLSPVLGVVLSTATGEPISKALVQVGFEESEATKVLIESTRNAQWHFERKASSFQIHQRDRSAPWKVAATEDWTSKRGHFEVFAPRGIDWWLAVSKPGFITRTISKNELLSWTENAGVRGLKIELEASRQIAGRVLVDPIAESDPSFVSVRWCKEHITKRFRLQPTENPGVLTFEAQDMEPGAGSFSLESGSRAPYVQGHHAIDRIPYRHAQGTQEIVLDFRAQETPAHVTGQVSFPEGVELTAGSIQLFRTKVGADPQQVAFDWVQPNGRYHFNLREPGSYFLLLSGTDWETLRMIHSATSLTVGEGSLGEFRRDFDTTRPSLRIRRSEGFRAETWDYAWVTPRRSSDPSLVQHAIRVPKQGECTVYGLAPGEYRFEGRWLAEPSVVNLPAEGGSAPLIEVRPPD